MRAARFYFDVSFGRDKKCEMAFSDQPQIEPVGISRPRKLLSAVRERLTARPKHRFGWLSWLSLALAIALLAPIAGVLLSAATTDHGTIAHLSKTVLPRYAINSVLLALGVAAGVMVIGTATAGLVVFCEFPGRRIFEWALIVPLAFPAYIVAYAYTDLLSHPGLVQSTLRTLTGWGPRDYWFPEIRSLGGAIVMFTVVLYPYVYLLARNAFLQQSRGFSDAARTLGRSPFQVFLQTSLPLARPAVVAGTTLALMETLADYGTVAHFGVQTFTTGIYRAWYSMDDLAAAAKLASLLLMLVFTLILVERLARKSASYRNSHRISDLPRYRLSAGRGWAAAIACALPVLLGFVLPIVTLAHLHWIDGHDIFSGRYQAIIWNSVLLGGLAAGVATLIATTIAFAGRLSPSPTSQLASRLVQLGYAVPGSVIAIGILLPLAGLDNGLDAFMRATFGVSTGLLLTGSVAALIFAYCIRFMAVSLNAIETSLIKIPKSIDAAALTLGSTPAAMLRRVHLPLIREGLLTAILLVFVDVMKELPATLILRPFNFDTLAVQAHKLASDERLAQASTPSLILVTVGLIPVILLSRQIMRTRSGRSAKP